MKKRALLLSLLGLLLLVSLACSTLAAGGRRSEGVGEASTGGVDIKITNRSPDEVCYVMISPSLDENWGEDELADDETIAPGGDRLFSVDDGIYDVLVESCEEVTMATAWEVAGDTTVTVGAPEANTRLLVENDADAAVCYIYVSSAFADDWGDDSLGDMEQLSPGDRRLFYVQSGTYDLRARDCDGEVLVEEYNVDLTEDLTWTLFEE